MSAVGSLIFCTDCGNLMDPQLNASKDLECDQCDANFPSASEYESGSGREIDRWRDTEGLYSDATLLSSIGHNDVTQINDITQTKDFIRHRWSNCSFLTVLFKRLPDRQTKQMCSTVFMFVNVMNS